MLFENGSHYDLISLLVKQRVLFVLKSNVVNVSYCGGISLVVNAFNEIYANINGVIYPIDVQGRKQPPRCL